MIGTFSIQFRELIAEYMLFFKKIFFIKMILGRALEIGEQLLLLRLNENLSENFERQKTKQVVEHESIVNTK